MYSEVTFRECRQSLVLRGQYRIRDGPGDRNFGVVPLDSSVEPGIVFLGHFVRDIGSRFTQDHISVSEPRWNPELNGFIRGHLDSDPLLERIRPCAKIHGYVKDFTPYNAYEFTLDFGWELKMEPPQHPVVGTNEGVLDEVVTDCGEGAASVRLGKVPAFVHMVGLLDQEDVGDCERCEIESHE